MKHKMKETDDLNEGIINNDNDDFGGEISEEKITNNIGKILNLSLNPFKISQKEPKLTIEKSMKNIKSKEKKKNNSNKDKENNYTKNNININYINSPSVKGGSHLNISVNYNTYTINSPLNASSITYSYGLDNKKKSEKKGNKKCKKITRVSTLGNNEGISKLINKIDEKNKELSNIIVNKNSSRKNSGNNNLYSLGINCLNTNINNLIKKINSSQKNKLKTTRQFNNKKIDNKKHIILFPKTEVKNKKGMPINSKHSSKKILNDKINTSNPNIKANTSCNMNTSNILNKTEIKESKIPVVLNKSSVSFKNTLNSSGINENLYAQFNMNSIEEEQISPRSFICLGNLGHGSFGEVYLVQKINTKENFAMKVLKKDKVLNQNLLKYVLAERNVLSQSNHPFIVKLNYAFQTSTRLFLILEFCPYGDLSKHLMMEKKFSEERAKFYICEIILALEYLHKKNIIFRDLKPANIVIDNSCHAKLTDFGLSKEGVSDGYSAKSFCGSIAYLAPEVLQKKGHGKAVDWYLLGVLFYECIVGVTPFFTQQRENIFHNIEYGELRIPDYVSPKVADLLRCLLERDPQKRLGGGPGDSEEIKKHPYFEDVNWDDVYNKRIPAPNCRKLGKKIIKLFHHPKFFASEEETEINKKNMRNELPGWSFIINDEY